MAFLYFFDPQQSIPPKRGNRTALQKMIFITIVTSNLEILGLSAVVSHLIHFLLASVVKFWILFKQIEEFLTLEIVQFGESSTDDVVERYPLKEELFLTEVLPHSVVFLVTYYIVKCCHLSSLYYP